MLAVKDLTQAEEMLTDFKEYTRVRRVNGERTITLTVVPSENNEHAYPMVQEESKILHDEDEYVLKKHSEKSVGKKSIKRVEGIHKFYVDLASKQQYKIHNGSITFNNFMNLVFEGTGYTFVALDTFPANSFENLGNDTRLALLQKGLDRFKAELELVGTQVRFKKQIGNDTDFQFRYGHNIKTISIDTDTTAIKTVIKGKWEDGMELEYRSPNADILGEIEAPLFTDERFTSRETRLEAMKEALNDTIEFSITIDFADLRAAGYPYTVPNEGDRVFVIYEPMDDLLIETRILEITEKFDHNLKPIKTTVTLANSKKTFAKAMFDSMKNQMSKITNEDGMIKYDVLDEAVRIATEALQSAQTELIFDNGIIARDKNDPNKVVLFNSAGIGISSDGGKTFKTAMTGLGIVAEVIIAGIVKGLRLEGGIITGVEINGSEFNTTGSDNATVKIVDGLIRSKSSGSRPSEANLWSGLLDISRESNVSSNLRYNVRTFASGLQLEVVDTSSNSGRVLGYFNIVDNSSANMNDWTSLLSVNRINADVVNESSIEDLKEEISIWEDSAIEILKNSSIHKYKHKVDKNTWRYGFVIGKGYNTPIEVIAPDGKSVTGYSHRSLNTKAIQELIEENEQRKAEIAELTTRLEALESAN